MKMKNSQLSHPIKGALAILCTTAIYGSWGVLSRVINEEFGVFSQYMLRYGIVLMYSFIILRLTKKWVRIKNKDIRWLAVWIGSNIIGDTLIFLAFNQTKISTVLFSLYSGMLVSGIASGYMLFHERLTLIKIISLAVTMFGLFIMFIFGNTQSIDLGMVYALLGGIFGGIWNTSSKKISDTYDHNQLSFLWSLCSVIGNMILMIIIKESIPQFSLSPAWITIIFLGLGSILNVRFVIYGFQQLGAQTGSLILPMEVVFGSLFAFLMYRELPSYQAFIGGLCIIAATILLSVSPDIHQKKAKISP